MTVSGQVLPDRTGRRISFILLALGFLLQLWLWSRSIWIYRDQVELYEVGLALARDGDLLPFGKLATGDYPIPGVFLELLIGLPLMGWMDYRASTLVIFFCHLGSAVILVRLLSRDLGWQVTAWFLAIYWLSPWRFYHSGFLWETNYLFLPAALHLWSSRQLAEQRRLGASLVMALTIVLTAQIHGSFLILGLCSLFLMIKRRQHLHWAGATVGALVGMVPLLPTLLTLARGQSLPVEPSELPAVSTRLNSVFKALSYWFRTSSVDLGRRFRQSTFCIEPGGGDVVPEPFLCWMVRLTEVLALMSVVVALWACWRLWRRYRSDGDPDSTQPTIRTWYRTYCGAMFWAVLVAALLSPVLIQGWHVLIAMPTACLAVTLGIAAAWPRANLWFRVAVMMFVCWRVPATLLLAGHPMYAAPAEPDLPLHMVPQDLQLLID